MIAVLLDMLKWLAQEWWLWLAILLLYAMFHII
jgi:hypothetical protein